MRDGNRHEDDNGGNVNVLGPSSSADQYDLSFPYVKTETWHFKQEVDEANSEIPSAPECIGEPCPIAVPKIKMEIKCEVEENDVDYSGDPLACNELEERIKDEDKEKIIVDGNNLSDHISDAIIVTQGNSEPLWDGGATCKWQTYGSSESTSYQEFVEEFEMKNDLDKEAHIQKDKYLSCSVCQVSFADEEISNIHGCSHSVQTSHLHSTDSNKMDKCSHPGETHCPCSLCSASFSQNSTLVQHIHAHRGEKPFSCSLCSARFCKKSDLVNHIHTHTGEKPFSCSLCRAKFSRKASLQSHIRAHKGVKPFSCSMCSARFLRKSILFNHIRTHTGEKPFSCSLCSAKFSQKGHLERHSHKHTGEKPFSCSVCSAKFSEKGHLERHIRKHTGEKPFSCSVCSANFTRKANLKSHIHAHTVVKPFSCSVCSANFTRKANLKSHVHAHIGVKSF